MPMSVLEGEPPESLWLREYALRKRYASMNERRCTQQETAQQCEKQRWSHAVGQFFRLLKWSSAGLSGPCNGPLLKVHIIR
jgi:hypothetical protein